MDIWKVENHHGPHGDCERFSKGCRPQAGFLGMKRIMVVKKGGFTKHWKGMPNVRRAKRGQSGGVSSQVSFKI